MNYLTILPLNIHKEIASMLHFEELFDFEWKITNKYEISFTRKYTNNDILKFINEYGYNNSFTETLYFSVESCTLIDNKFTIINKYLTYRKIIFTGNNLLLILDDSVPNKPNIRVIYLTNTAVQHLFVFLREYIKCDICKAIFNMKIINNKIETNDYLINTDNPQCKGHLCRGFGNKIEKYHTNCKKICNKCNNFICSRCSVTCLLCRSICCGLQTCMCMVDCYKCNKKICTKSPDTYYSKIINNGKKILYYCLDCTETCFTCNLLYKRRDIHTCDVCNKLYCNQNPDCEKYHLDNCLTKTCGSCSNSFNYIYTDVLECPDCNIILCKNCKIKCDCHDEKCPGFSCGNCTSFITVNFRKSLIKEGRPTVSLPTD